MNRRQALRTAGITGMAALAGCVSPLESPTFLPGSTNVVDAGEIHMLFAASNGTEKLTVALLYHQAAAAKRHSDPLPFAVSINPHEGIRLNHIKLELRSPPKVSSTTLPAAVHLKAPEATSFPQLQYYADPTKRLATIIEVPELESEQQGTAFSFRFLIQPFGEEETTRIRVSVDTALSEAGGISKRRYNALGAATIEISGG